MRQLSAGQEIAKRYAPVSLDPCRIAVIPDPWGRTNDDTVEAIDIDIDHRSSRSGCKGRSCRS